MKKIFYYLMLTSTIISGFAFVYYFINIDQVESYKILVGLFFECLISGIITILLEDRPRITEHQKRIAKKIEDQAFGILILTFGLIFIILVASSCSHKGYGCHGRGKIMTRVQ